MQTFPLTATYYNRQCIFATTFTLIKDELWEERREKFKQSAIYLTNYERDEKLKYPVDSSLILECFSPDLNLRNFKI